MNRVHLELCGSDEWADAVRQWIIPDTIRDEDLGADVLELGPGPGRTTDVLRTMVDHLTAVEIHDELAAALTARMAGTNVDVVHGDATKLPFEDGRFSAVVTMTMLHHVPSPEMQDKVFAEAARVLRPGGVFVGSDSLDSDDFRALHVDDICVPVPPETLADRLTDAGFTAVDVHHHEPYVVRFRATR